MVVPGSILSLILVPRVKLKEQVSSSAASAARKRSFHAKDFAWLVSCDNPRV
jgi:hypothetical protein